MTETVRVQNHPHANPPPEYREREKHLHRNNAAERLMLLCIAPFILFLRALRAFVVK
jgi:hypothetical protein